MSTTIEVAQALGSAGYLTEADFEAAALLLENATPLAEAQEAVNQVKAGEETIELSPQSRYIRRLQHLIAERSNLSSQSTGKDPHRRVRIYRG